MDKMQPSHWMLTTAKQDTEEKRLPKLPIPPLLVTALPAKKAKNRKSLEEKAASKRAQEKARSQTRINVGAAFQRWRQLMYRLGLRSDADVAIYLLDSYEKNPSPSTILKPGSKNPPAQHVSTIVSKSLIDRDNKITEEEKASAAINYKYGHPSSSTGSSSGNTEWLHIKKEEVDFKENQVGNQLCGQQQSDSITVVKTEDVEEKPVTQLTEVNIKEEPQTFSLAYVIKKEEDD